jgi:signal transduction histidine kinase
MQKSEELKKWIVSYNHYLKNSLTVLSGAIMLLDKQLLAIDYQDTKHIDLIKKSVKDIDTFLSLTSDLNNFEKAEYVEGSEYYKLKE